MVTLRRHPAVLLLGSLTLLACAPTASSGERSDPTIDPTDAATTNPGEPTASTVDETEGSRPGVVAREGSVEWVLAGLPEASNFWAGVENWLSEVPGQEGVLRNARGITLFVPVDDGFSDEARDEAFADADTSAQTIGEHLVVGIVDPVEGTVVTAAGSSHEVTDGPALGGRRLIRTEVASNGVVHLIDGPLRPAGG